MEEKILVTQSSMPPYEEYIEAIKPLWDTHWLTNMGKYHMELEEKLKEYLDVPNLSLMVNGHMSLELAIQAFDFPIGGEVITTPFTFISTTHAIVRNHLQPVFCDVKETDGTIDETKIEELITEKTVAILPVHVYGNICNIEAIEEIADRYNLKVIYDAAHTFGIKYKGRGIGSYGDASCFSFHATKVFNTIEGGAVAFQNPKMYDRLRDLKNFGIRGEELVRDVGANAKMNELCAIMGLCNLKHIDQYIANRESRYNFYLERIKKISGISFLHRNSEATNCYSYFPILITQDYPMSRDMLYDKLKENNIYSRKYFYPITADQACFKNRYKNCELSVARNLSKNILVLPFYDELTEDNMLRVCKILENCGSIG